MDIYRMQIIPKVMYMATKAAWSIKQYRRMDMLVARLLKLLGGQMSTASNMMMFFPQEQCGSGLHPPSDLAQMRKWAELVRVINSNTESSEAVCGLLERALRQMALNALPTVQRSLYPDNQEFLKGSISSLVAWGGEVGCLLTNTARYEYTDSNAPIMPFMEGANKLVLRDIQRCDLTVQGELVQRDSDGGMKWISSNWCDRIRVELADNLIASPDDSGMILNTGQMYLVNNEYLEIIGKIHASDPKQVLCYSWQECKGSVQHIWRYKNVLATRCIRPMDAFKDIIRLVVRADNMKDDENCLVAQVLSRSGGVSPCWGTPAQSNIPVEILQFAQRIVDACRTTGVSYRLYTDGSYSIAAMPKYALLQTSIENSRNGKASASIVAVACHELWRNYEIFVLRISPSEQHMGGQAYVAELIALLVAIQVANVADNLEVYSDCKAAIDTVKKVHSKHSRRSQFSDVRPILGILEDIEDLPRIEWVSSHPEKRTTDSSLWQAHDWGSYMADMAAKGQMRKLVAELDIRECNVVNVPMDKAIMYLLVPGAWYWRSKESNLPILHPIIQLHSDQRSLTYFKLRDEYRADRGEESRWVGSSLALAAKCWKQVASGVYGSNIALKNCLDKYYHGRNRAKGLVGVEAQHMLACHICGKHDSQKHIILECNHEELRRIRKGAKNNVKDAVRKEKKEHGKECKYIARVVDFVLEKGFDVQYLHYDRIWTGLWNISVLDDALSFGSKAGEKFPDTLEYHVICSIQESIGRVTGHLTEALRDIMRVHREAYVEIEEEDEVHSNANYNECVGAQRTAVCKRKECIQAEYKGEDLGPNGASIRGHTKKIYGGKCSGCSRKKTKKKSRKKKEEEKRLDLVLSEGCRICLDSNLRGEGSVIEDTSHPAGATCFRDHDHD